ncbi:MAG: 16S rRNA (guanine(527)-N(7))-methyltransferase RsmG [Bacteroidetes bacterium]|nr:MAG: 16S rRNA (guanine(527)-N(7))-methyltransferase RsmG [Bacteroidota bacterium]
MNDISVLEKYFPELSALQKEQFKKLSVLYADWNQKINVISRKDMENLYVHHVLHSLGIAKVIQFEKGTRILDAGTGGGFPGIPLAILFPECTFHLVDSVGKKITVVKAIAEELGLTNLSAEKVRVEEIKDKFDFVVSRAVTSLKEMYSWTNKLIQPGGKNTLQNGMLFLKGGDLHQEIRELSRKVLTFDLNDFFKEEFFETKRVIYIRVNV